MRVKRKTTCQICGRLFPYKLRKRRNFRIPKHCSRECFMASPERRTRERPGFYFHEEKKRWFAYWNENGKRFIQSKATWMWERAYGPVPEGKVVHHVDGDSEHDVLDNFELKDRDEHCSMHHFFDGLENLKGGAEENNGLLGE
jgi:hypothetical protein